MEDGEVQDDFRPRSYQEQLMLQAKSKNTIIYLPTGSGKTFIAVMLVKELSASLDKGKKTFFMVNTVALVSQQAAYIRRHTHHLVGQYSGDLNVDLWSQEKWMEELDKYQIMVMTSQIFLNLLTIGYVQLCDVNLLIFDECHHAVNDQPMRLVMQRFEDCPPELQPRILGLTATLLNSNCKPSSVHAEVRSLETTFLSTVATCDNMPLLDDYSTNPDESMVLYNPDNNKEGQGTLNRGLEMLKHAQDFLDCILFELDQVVANGTQPPNTEILNNSKSKTFKKKLKNLLNDCGLHIGMLALFGGSRACLAHIIQLELLRKKCEDMLTKQVITSLITTLTAVRKLYEDEMSDCTLKSQIYKYSSYKVLSLIEILRKCMPKTVTENNKPASPGDPSESTDISWILEEQMKKKNKFCTIVFVERRFTAKLLFLVLKALKENDEDFKHLNPDFIVGFNNNPFNDTREGAYEKFKCQESIRKFLNGETNLLVASDVLEEGIDIQRCNLVIKFDLPKNYRSYVQSKGRARHKNSQYIILVPDDNETRFKSKYNEYRGTERSLQNLLVGRTEERCEPSEDEVAAELYDQLIPPFCTTCAQVNLTSAIPLVNRYCSMLPQDKFTQLSPMWYIKGVTQKRTVYLQLPMNSGLIDVIEGQEMPNKKLAKRATALETCRILYEAGELTENLLPRGFNTPLLECQELFPHYDDADCDSPEGIRPGTKKRKQYYTKQFPATLSECRPEAGVNLYLHVIEQTPVYHRPEDINNRKLEFYKMLHSAEGFGIVSSKPMPQLCDFPIYMNVGELKVHVVNDAAHMCLLQSEVQELADFNCMVFRDLLKLMKHFLIVDPDNLENSYFIVPTRRDESGRHAIDWEVVRQHKQLPKIQQPSLEERQNLAVTEDQFKLTVVAPWYRGMLPDQSYIVTQVCEDLTPQSPFPSAEFVSYSDYFHRKYKLNILNVEQPLLEVKAISSKINCLRPRSTKSSSATSKRKRHELEEDFEENLVAELCMRFKFPAVLWLKATCLPTILHRVNHLLIAEELRQTIARETGVGCVRLPDNERWLPLSADECCLREQPVITNPLPQINLAASMSAVKVSENQSSLSGASLNWGGDTEPVDIDRNMDVVTLVEVLNYDEFISKPLHSRPVSADRLFSNGPASPPPQVEFTDVTMPKLVPHRRIAILDTDDKGLGPQQCEVLQALTSASANDILNLERLETLGDSYLKLMSSLYLFLRYTRVDEGKLTHIKGKLIGNRNLYYIGKNKNLGGMMKVHDFVPTSDWIPPSMCVLRKIQQVMRMTKVSPNMLYNIEIPQEEQLTGVLSEATRTYIEDCLLNGDEDNGIHSSMENFLSLQTVPDKTIADGVEALIGAYLKASGVRGALKLLGWLEVLPATIATPERLLDKPPPSAVMDDKDVEVHLEGVHVLEERLNYRFRDRSFLLQALTHASYFQNRVTDCYQRLEYLGDAVLDFLITCHIYESCGVLSPGDLTDLRSALVNNVTFASLAVRYGFHTFLKYTSPKLMDMVDRFVKYQDEHNHVINEEVLILLEEEETHLAEAVEVPKVLGDLFESIAGAIYLDSGLDLKEVWRVYYQLMHKEIDEFSKVIPKNPVRLLYELATQAPKFYPTRQLEDGIIMVRVDLFIDGRKRAFHGFGETKIRARRAAAKCAYKALKGK